MATTVTVPDWVVTSGVWVKHNWTTVLGVVVVAIIASITVEVLKRHAITTEDKVKAKKVITWLMVVFTTLFSWLSYVIFFVQSNLSFVQSLPVVGSHAVEALGVGLTLYNLRLNKWYGAFASWANGLSKPKVPASPTESVPSLPETESNFEVQ